MLNSLLERRARADAANLSGECPAWRPDLAWQNSFGWKDLTPMAPGSTWHLVYHGTMTWYTMATMVYPL